MTIWLTIDELSKYIKKSRSTLYRMTRQGQIPGQKIGRTWLFDRDEIDSWLKSGKAGIITNILSDLKDK